MQGKSPCLSRAVQHRMTIATDVYPVRLLKVFIAVEDF